MRARPSRISIPVMRTATIWRSAVVLMSIAAFVACGDDDTNDDGPTPDATQTAEPTPAGDPTLDNPCRLTDAEEVSGVLGEIYTIVQDNNPCIFGAPSGAQISIETTNYGDGAVQAFELSLNTFQGEEIQSPADRTMWINGFRELHLLVDGYVIIVKMPDPEAEAQQAQALALAAAMFD